jgi:hypothetical protein
MHESATGDKRFESAITDRMSKVFPRGVENASLKDFNGLPADGVLVKQSNNLVLATGMNKGNVIVACQGMRVHNFLQYRYARESRDTPQLDLVVWNGTAYREVTASPPDHRFGVNFGDYPPK